MLGSTGGGWKRSDLATVTGVAQPTGEPAEDRPRRYRQEPPPRQPSTEPTSHELLNDFAEALGPEFVCNRARRP